MTENLKTIAEIPKVLTGAPEQLVVRGEVYMRRSVFEEINAQRELEEQSLVNLQKVMEHAGELSRSQWVDFDRLVDNSWAKNIS